MALMGGTNDATEDTARQTQLEKKWTLNSARVTSADMKEVAER